MSQRSLRRSTQISTKASLAIKKQEQAPSADDTDSAALSLITMQKEATEASNSNTPEVPSTAKKVADSIAAAAAANQWPLHPWGSLTPPLPLARPRSRSRSRSRTRDLPPNAVKPSADASSHAPSEATEEVAALKGRLQNDINILFVWRQGMTNRLDGQNRKVDAAWAIATEGVRLAKIAGVSASDAMTRANDAMKEAEEALKRAKNVFNTAVNEHGPSLRKVKDRVAHLEKQVEDLDRDSRAMSRTLISGGAGAASGSGEISDLRLDVRRLQRDVDGLYAPTHSNENRLADSEAAHNALKAQVEALDKELAQEKAKVAYLLQRDYASFGQPAVQQQQPTQPQSQPQPQQTYSANAGYPSVPYPMPPMAASASSQHKRVA